MREFFKNKRILIMHISFWCIYLSFFIFQIIRFQRGDVIDWSHIIKVAAINLIFTMLIAYFNYFYILPKYLSNKNALKYILEFIIWFAIIVTIRLQLERYIIDGYTYQATYLYTTRFTIQIVFVTLFIVIFVAMLRFSVDWFELEARKKEIENEKLSAELNFLKAQINPHFLFNTLNNLYYLAYTKSENTTEVIAKLSQMMRYMIYDSNHPQVLLSKEIEYMESYISLERLRLNNEIPIEFVIEGNVGNVLISPLIFITFLENAFKHGVSSNQPGAWVKIAIHVCDKKCIYTVTNSKIVKAKAEKEENSGIGLKNVNRRLELSYPNQYDLKVKDEDDKYMVQLKLDLD
jgi:hypothetical protein